MIEYHEVFVISAVICVVGALVAMFLGRRHAGAFAAEKAVPEPDPEPAAG